MINININISESTNLWTLTSFIRNLEKEKGTDQNLNKAFDFGRAAIRVSNQFRERRNTIEIIDSLVDSALLVSSNMYRIYLLQAKKSVDSDGQKKIQAEAKKELRFCQKLLEHLDSMVLGFSLVKEMKEQAASLQNIL